MKPTPSLRNNLFSVFICLAIISFPTNAIAQRKYAFDVMHYDAQIEPDITNKSITGKVLIHLISKAARLSVVQFDCGELTIDAVREHGHTLKFSRNNSHLNVSLSPAAKINETREIEVEYHGIPRRGIRFFPDRNQIYTVYATSQWLVCIDAPDDKASLRLTLTVPASAMTVSNGRLISTRSNGNKTSFTWQQSTAIPTYTFGFAIGKFRTISEQHGRLSLRYLASDFSDEELRQIFRNTADMIGFFERRAGVPYADETYTQVLAAGGVEQEMSSFTVLRETYGNEILADGRDLWLAAHELAHQWWGNMVTCRDWNHFWLNEGMASFMADAYKEHHFGRDVYLREIEIAQRNYEKVRDAGKDKSLVFRDWSHPTAEDRTLVYDKGAYVLHLLREELGELAFWRGIRQYTRKYFGGSVTTSDFQTAMEIAAKRDLSCFFNKWVYLRERADQK